MSLQASPQSFIWPPAVTIYSHDQARQAALTALRYGSGLTLLSASRAAEAVGVGWMASLGRLIREEFSVLTLYTVLDCGTAGGRAMAALRAEIDAIVFTGTGRSLTALADQADTYGKGLLPERPANLDFMHLPNEPGRAATLLAGWFKPSPISPQS